MFGLINDSDLTPEQMRQVLDAADAGDPGAILAGRSVLLLFLARSTRTRVSLEVAITSLGGHPVLVDEARSRVADGETIADTGRVLAEYFDLAFVRAYQRDLDEFTSGFSKIVVNAGNDWWHPTQILADLLTLRQRHGDLAGTTISYVGDGNDMCNSLMVGACSMGMHVRVGTPPEHRPEQVAIDLALARCELTGGSLEFSTDPMDAVFGAQAVYTDVWRAMTPDDGAEHHARVAEFSAYQVNEKLLGNADPDVLFLHCLPARRDEEVTSAVLDGDRSVVLDQARNRTRVNKALIQLLPEFAGRVGERN